MQIVRVVRIVGLSLAAASVAGCGLFKSSSSDRLDPNDPTRAVASMIANVSSFTTFADATTGSTATYKARLLDKDGNQFYGPKVQLDGADVATDTPSDSSSTIYLKSSIAFTPGQTFATTVQGFSAASPPAIPQLLATSPVKSTTTDTSTNPPTVTTLSYYKQAAGQPMTITWSGGDPAQPVYIFIYGTPDTNPTRRYFVSDDPLQSILDPENFGKPIPNTGTYTIPATLIERYLDSSGNTATRTINAFDDPVTTDTSGRAFYVYVAQRQTTIASPIRFGFVSVAQITASVLPKV